MANTGVNISLAPDISLDDMGREQFDPQRKIWRASLKRLDIRYRDPYNMRHSYATFGLMNNANPAFMANQLGHSVEEFFKKYAKWINRLNNQAQIDFIEQGLNKK